MEEMRAKTLKGVQEQNYRSHCTFRPLHLLSPFPSTQTHSFQPRTNSSPSWPTSHLHFHSPNQSSMQQPIFLFFSFSFPFLFFPSLAHHFPLSSPMQTPITPLAHHFPLFPLLVFCMNSPLNTLPTCKPAAKTPCWQPLEDLSFGYKSHQEREGKGWSFGEKKVD